MSAYIIFDSNVKDMEKVKTYSASAGKLVAAHGGEFLAKGPVEVLSGDSDYKLLVLIAFPSMDSALGFYHSDEYQALIALREEAMSSVVKIIGG